MGYHMNGFITFVKNTHNDEENARLLNQIDNIS